MAETVNSWSFNISLSIFSMPFLSVNVEEGQPLQAPCNKTSTFLVSALKDLNSILPPSLSTAGFIYSSSILTIDLEISSKASNFFR
jgi:hypothetical protein